MGSLWREDIYVEWLHAVDELSIKDVRENEGPRWAAQRLDARRKPSRRVDPLAPVAPSLPAQCYQRRLESSIPFTERYLLANKDSRIESLELLLSRTLRLLR